MLIAQQSIAPSAGREDDGGEKKKESSTKRKYTALGGKVEKNTNNGMKQTNKQKQNAIFHKKMNL